MLVPDVITSHAIHMRTVAAPVIDASAAGLMVSLFICHKALCEAPPVPVRPPMSFKRKAGSSGSGLWGRDGVNNSSCPNLS